LWFKRIDFMDEKRYRIVGLLIPKMERGKRTQKNKK
jgi:hypothetical protein